MNLGGMTCCWLVNDTFAEIYAVALKCPLSESGQRIFRQCLHRHAAVLAPILSVMSPDFFAPDHELIEQVGKSRTLTEIDFAIRNFFDDERNSHWLRKTGRVRVSTQRLRRVARRCLRPTPRAVPIQLPR